MEYSIIGIKGLVVLKMCIQKNIDWKMNVVEVSKVVEGVPLFLPMHFSV